MSRRPPLAGRLLAMAIAAAAATGVVRGSSETQPYAAAAEWDLRDTLRARTAESRSRSSSTRWSLGAVVPGYLSSRGLPPVQGGLTVTDTGLVFRSLDGSAAILPLLISFAYVDQSNGHPAYVFRIDAGVFETPAPGPLLEVAKHPVSRNKARTTKWASDRPLIDPTDSAALWDKARASTSSTYADSLHRLFGQPAAPVGLIGRRGRRAGRLGEYIAARDSLALDPGRMSSEAQLRHTLAHELGHRWQARSSGQLATLWWGVRRIRDPKRYGYESVSEHQAEAIAFAVDFLQTTVSKARSSATSMKLLDHYELLVPGTRTMVRYLALQPVYRDHPLRSLLIRG